MSDNTRILQIVFLIIINIPIFLLIGRIFFSNWEGFFKAIWFWAKPDLMSMFDGSYWEDNWNELLLFLFVFVCGILVYGEYYVIVNYIAK